jgi:hypothetical protein
MANYEEKKELPILYRIDIELEKLINKNLTPDKIYLGFNELKKLKVENKDIFINFYKTDPTEYKGAMVHEVNESSHFNITHK